MTFRQPNQADSPLSPVEERLHQEGMARMQNALDAGKTFVEAAAVLTDLSDQLQELVADDFLKIRIAEEHFNQGRDIGQVAISLGLDFGRVAAGREEMLEEVGREMAKQYRLEMARHSH
jgi:hypothetical protein